MKQKPFLINLTQIEQTAFDFEITSVDAAVAVDGRDAIVELTGTYLQPATEVSAHPSPAGVR